MTANQVVITGIFKDAISAGVDGIAKSWSRLETQLERVRQKFAPLTSQATQLVAAVASSAAFKKALDAAEEQAQAEARLGAALGENIGLLNKFVETASRIQGKTLFQDDALINQAAVLVNMGVSVGRIDDALQAAVDTSAALGLELETVVRSIGLFAEGSAGRLASRVPLLKELADNGTLATKGIEALTKAFGGTAEQLAKTPFGRYRSSLILITDQFETLGNVLIGPVNVGLKTLLSAMTTFTGVIGRLQNNPLLTTFAELGTQAVIATAALISGGIALKALAFAGSTVSTILGAVVAVLTSVPGLILAISVLLVGLVANVYDLSKAFGAVKEFLGLVIDGFVDFTTLFDSLKLTFKGFWTFIQTEVIIPLQVNIDSFLTEVPSRFKSFFLDIQIAGVKFARFLISSVFAPLLAEIVGTVDKATGAVATVIDKLGGDGSVVRTNLAGTISGIGSAVEAGLNAKIIELENASSDLLKKRAEDLAQIKLGGDLLIKQKQDEYTLAVNQAQLDADARAKQRRGDEDATNAAKRLNIERAKALRISQEQAAQAKLAIVQSGGSQDQLDKSKAIEVDLLQAKLEAGKISIAEFFQKRRDLENEFQAFKEAKVEKELAAVTASIEEELKKRQDAARVAKEGVTNISGLLETQATLEEQLNLLLLDRKQIFIDLAQEEASKSTQRAAEIQKLLLDLNVKALEAQGKSAEAVLLQQKQEAADLQAQLDKLGVSTEQKLQALDLLRIAQNKAFKDSVSEQAKVIATTVTDAEAKYRKTIEDTNEALKRRIITEKEARDRTSAALEEVSRRSTEAVQALVQLQAQYPQFADAIQKSLDGVNESLGKVRKEADQLGFSFRDGLVAGAKQFREEGLDSFAQGKQLFSDIANALANNLSGAIFDVISGTKSMAEAFRDFAVSTLNQIAQIIIRLLIVRAIASALGIPFLGLGANEGGLISRNRGGPIGFAGGGQVPGRGPNRDTVPAMLTRGEYVIDRDTVDYYGVNVLRAIHQRLIPHDVLAGYTGPGRYVPSGHYNSGGEVAGQGVSGNVAASVIVATETTMERLIHGGSGALLRFMQDNKEALR